MTAAPARELPHLPGIVTAAQLSATVDYIAGEQCPDGLLPWFTDYHADPWDHVEAAMALTVGGRLDEARAAYRWSAAHQRPDGSWPMEILHVDGVPVVREAAGDANQAGYLAVGLWHYRLVTGDGRFVRELWPSVRAAIDFAVDLQQPGGPIAWARDASGSPADEALLTGSACLVLSLRCALALADHVGDPQPHWELALGRLAHAVAVHPGSFADRSRFSMDWYYPVLGGAVTGAAGRALLAERADEFVVAGRGIRCVADRPWVTAAETCEFVLTLDAVGEPGRAAALLRDVQFLRDPHTGGYWTGWVFPEDVRWPQQLTTWTSGAVVLAADALTDTTPGAGIVRGDSLTPLPDVSRCDEQCVAVLRP